MADADRHELQGRLPQWEEEIGRRDRGPDERGSNKTDPKGPRKPGEPNLFTRQRAFEEEFAAIQVRRFVLYRPPDDTPPETSAEPTIGPPGAPSADPRIEPSVDPPAALKTRPDVSLQNDLDISALVRLRKNIERLTRRGS